jgi:CHAT domain-containing protein/Tfp pilus assembly protein PilF
MRRTLSILLVVGVSITSVIVPSPQPIAWAQTQNNQEQEAKRLLQLAVQQTQQGKPQQAIETLQQVLAIARQIPDKDLEALALLGIGFNFNNIGQRQKALDYYNQALPIFREVGVRAGEATTLNNIGQVYSEIGQPQKALDYYNQALPIEQEVKDRSHEATTLNNIGQVYNDIGQRQKALDYYHQALPIEQEVKDRSHEAATLNNIGQVYGEIGQPQKALDYYNQALPILRDVGDRSGEATTLNNIGLVYDDIGQPQKALDYYNQALPIRREVKDRAGEAATLNNIGLVYSKIGQPQKALDYYNQALPIVREVGNRSLEATTLSNIGVVYDKIGQPQKALDYYNQALPIVREVGNRSLEATTLSNIGLVYDKIGQPQKALDYYNQALPIKQEVKDRSGEATTLSNIAYVEHKGGNEEVALANIQKAITIEEQIRTAITAQELRISYFTTVQDDYKLYIDILMQLHKQHPDKGYDAQALQVSERDRARSLLELLTEAHADIRQGADPNLISQEQDLQQQLDALEKHRIQILSSNHTDTEAQALETQIQTLNEQYQQVEDQIRTTSPRYAALKQPQPLSLSQIQQQVLDDNTLLLEYSLGEEHSYLWAVTKTTLTSYQLPKGTDIDNAAKSFSQDLKEGMAKQTLVTKEANTLSQLLLAPVAQQLEQRRLLVVGDRALQYVPFAALPTPQSSGSKYQPLIVDHEIINLPSASTLAIIRQEDNQRQRATKTLIAFADPVFSRDDQRLRGKITGAHPPEKDRFLDQPDLKKAADDVKLNFPRRPHNRQDRQGNDDVNLRRLSYTRQEAESILSLVPVNQQQQALDFDASRATVFKTDLSQYQIVHFATHGILDDKHPELSGVVLSLFDDKGTPENGFLRLNDIFNLHLSANLVVLSACETGLGKDVKGEGLVGLTRGFMYAGTPRVVVSLWDVDDQATSELMTAFYQKMLQSGMKPGAALRAAQLEMWHNQQYAPPYYWAAFTLQGEW